MRLSSVANFASVAALAALLPLAIPSAHAVSAATAPVVGDADVQPSQFQRVAWGEEKREKLRHAYWLLEHADADYHGHRVKAMEHIKKAADVIGMDLHGHDYATTDQFKSDERMRRARALLHEVADESGGREHEHLRDAIHELDHALEVN
ncbi:MAG TPA: hypothetical protein VMR33_17735 [Candidatus Baltobacteraceae bacterium]|jgi:hypothetical protein|nr:hypothetical protein [Candidatus Baltobacteraceae bacterium]